MAAAVDLGSRCAPPEAPRATAASEAVRLMSAKAAARWRIGYWWPAAEAAPEDRARITAAPQAAARRRSAAATAGPVVRSRLGPALPAPRRSVCRPAVDAVVGAAPSRPVDPAPATEIPPAGARPATRRVEWRVTVDRAVTRPWAPGPEPAGAGATSAAPAAAAVAPPVATEAGAGAA